MDKIPINETPIKHNSIELFCGAGGLALGLQKAGFHHKALYELNKNACANIEANISAGLDEIKEWHVYQSDVSTVSYNNLNGQINMVSGGPPCQPFSLGGKAQAYNDKRDMFPEAVRAVQELMPEAFIFENVRGLLRKSFSSYFNYIILQLTYPSLIRQKGITWEEHLKLLEQHHASNHHNGEYNVVFKLLNAADYGVPQLRYRVIIVGFRKDTNAHWSFPQPTHSKESLLYSQWVSGDYWQRHNLLMPQNNPLSSQAIKKLRSLIEDSDAPLQPWQTTRDALEDLPDPQSEEAAAFNNHIFKAGAKAYPGHSGSVLDEPSKTLKAGVHGVPGGENMLVLDSGAVRYYTVRESARLQTFPDNYRFIASWTESMRQIGNAVPVKLAEVIGSSVLKQLNS